MTLNTIVVPKTELAAPQTSIRMSIPSFATSYRNFVSSAVPLSLEVCACLMQSCFQGAEYLEAPQHPVRGDPINFWIETIPPLPSKNLINCRRYYRYSATNRFKEPGLIAGVCHGFSYSWSVRTNCSVTISECGLLWDGYTDQTLSSR